MVEVWDRFCPYLTESIGGSSRSCFIQNMKDSRICTIIAIEILQAGSATTKRPDCTSDKLTDYILSALMWITPAAAKSLPGVFLLLHMPRRFPPVNFCIYHKFLHLGCARLLFLCHSRAESTVIIIPPLPPDTQLDLGSTVLGLTWLCENSRHHLFNKIESNACD